MPAINADTRDAWQQIAKDLESERPSVGKRVESLAVRGKTKGRSGTVIRHEIDRFDRSAYRYGNEASHHMRDMAGTYGWACLVRDDAGQTFWIRADRVKIVPPPTPEYD